MPTYNPPTGMIVDATAQWVITGIQLVAAVLVTAWVLYRRKGGDIRLSLLVLLGGGLSVFFEPLGDRLGLIWHASVGQWTLLHMYGHSVPLWMLGAYYWYCGGQTLYVVTRLRDAASSRELWRLYWIFLLMDGVLELPVLYMTQVYTYFGNQPFWWPPYFPLPGWYLVLNALLPLAAGRAVAYLLSLERTGYQWFIPVVIPMSLFAVYGATAWPVWAALNSDVTKMTSTLCGAVTIGLGLLVANLLSSSAPRRI